MKRIVICLGALVLVWCAAGAAHAFTEYDHSAVDHPVGEWETDSAGNLEYDPDADPTESQADNIEFRYHPAEHLYAPHIGHDDEDRSRADD